MSMGSAAAPSALEAPPFGAVLRKFVVYASHCGIVLSILSPHLGDT
jgi:hypothetical protein